METLPQRGRRSHPDAEEGLLEEAMAGAVDKVPHSGVEATVSGGERSYTLGKYGTNGIQVRYRGYNGERARAIPGIHSPIPV